MNRDLSSHDFVQKVLAAFEVSNNRMQFRRGDFLLRAGEIEQKLYFIEQGGVKLYYLSGDEERIVRFGYDGSIINSLASFLHHQPSEFSIEAIRQTTVKVIPKSLIMELKDEDSLAYSNFLESLLIQQIDREIDLLISSPVERLERVLKRSPNLFQHIPLRYIAEYLRMKPETLSRIRNS